MMASATTCRESRNCWAPASTGCISTKPGSAMHASTRFIANVLPCMASRPITARIGRRCKNLVANLHRQRLRQKAFDADGEDFFIGQFFYARLIETLDVKHHGLGPSIE